MKKKYFVTSKDKKDWVDFTKQIGNISPKQDDLSRNNIEINKDERFNLTLQRVAPDSGVVLDQEIHRRLTCEPDSDLYVGSVLAVSSLMQVCGPIPSGRPASTDTGYVEQDEAGTDGLALSDYDLIGSANRGTGMFGLNAIEECMLGTEIL